MFIPCSLLLYTAIFFKSIYNLCLSGWVSVCLCPINVKIAEPIGPKFYLTPHITPGKVYEWAKFQKLVSNKIRFSLNVENPRHFLFCFTRYTQRKINNWNRRSARRALKALFIFTLCLSVFSYSINVKTAEPIGPKILRDHTPG